MALWGSWGGTEGRGILVDELKFLWTNRGLVERIRGVGRFKSESVSSRFNREGKTLIRGVVLGEEKKKPSLKRIHLQERVAY